MRCRWVADSVSNRRAKRQIFWEREWEKKGFSNDRSISMYKDMKLLKRITLFVSFYIV